VSDAATSMKEPGILIRPLQEAQDMHLGVELQRRVWGYSETDTVPEQIFVVAKESGGQVLAAFDQGKAIGFALAFAGLHHGKVYLHSHMVAVVPEYQDRGVGRLLKLAQRDDAIARGYDLIEWTFDPLQLKNAYFNLVRLGAIVRRYIPNCYGRTSSPLHAGLPTDRLVAEWWIKSARVQDVLSAKALVPAANATRISIPAAIRHICTSDPSAAEKIQSRVREEFEKCISDGRAAVGFELDENKGSYILECYED
jgi:predicted GNAT superfamily acetyltransferase